MRRTCSTSNGDKCVLEVLNALCDIATTWRWREQYFCLVVKILNDLLRDRQSVRSMSLVADNGSRKRLLHAKCFTKQGCKSSNKSLTIVKLHGDACRYSVSCNYIVKIMHK